MGNQSLTENLATFGPILIIPATDPHEIFFQFSTLPCQCDRDLTINLRRIFCRLMVKNDASQVAQGFGLFFLEKSYFAQLLSYVLLILQGHAKPWDRLMENKH